MGTSYEAVYRLEKQTINENKMLRFFDLFQLKFFDRYGYYQFNKDEEFDEDIIGISAAEANYDGPLDFIKEVNELSRFPMATMGNKEFSFDLGFVKAENENYALFSITRNQLNKVCYYVKNKIPQLFHDHQKNEYNPYTKLYRDSRDLPSFYNMHEELISKILLYHNLYLALEASAMVQGISTYLSFLYLFINGKCPKDKVFEDHDVVLVAGDIAKNSLDVYLKTRPGRMLNIDGVTIYD